MQSPLTARSFVLLTPDMINFDWDCPIYGKVKKVNLRTVQVEGLHSAAGNTWSVRKLALVNSRVSAQEAQSNTTGPLLRQAVVAEHDVAFHFGQVITVSGSEAVVRLSDETVETSITTITPIAPVVAVLLQNLAFSKSEWSLEEILEMSNSIVDKICGSGTTAGSRDIGTILELQATSDGSHVKARCSLDDADLRQLLHQIQQRHIQELQAAFASAPIKPQSGFQKQQVVPKSRDVSHNKINRVIKTEPSIPPEIYALLPSKNDKRLCLRYLSNAGCKSDSATSCHALSRAHFIPDSLDNRVRDLITAKFGGLKDEYTNL
ncbi:hypothetical protein PHMEG_00016644 [Phytophthora megakarya]|uniref:Uncharacterized protein n=1 Tax=Phytophthora megakarya TaxID=4795 RepID=A0A225VZE9_9STRA|nr:hypothetical protein PHMEG_00016644 [Phytophthora megakarya]